MNEKQLSQFTVYFVGLVTITIWSLLIWQYLNEGVPSHHLLQRADLPEISNWWGAILLPALSWGLLVRIKKRIMNNTLKSRSIVFNQAGIGLAISLVYGAILSLSFLYDYSEVSSIMFPGILFFALFFKVYREEFILGFILSMSFVFGAVLPTIFATLIAFISATVYFVVHFIWLRIKSITTRKQAT